MKNKLIKMFTACSILAFALMCSVNVTLANAEKQTEASGEATTTSDETIIEDALIPIKEAYPEGEFTFTNGDVLYFGGKNMKYVDEWISKNHSFGQDEYFKIFSYGPGFAWQFKYSGELYRLIGTKEQPIANSFLFNPEYFYRFTTGYEYSTLTFNYTYDDSNVCSFAHALDETYEDYEIVNLFLDCFYILKDESTPEIVYQSNNYFNDFVYSSTGEYEEHDLLLSSGDELSNVIPLINTYDERITKMYLSFSFNLDEVVNIDTVSNSFKMYLFNENMNCVGVQEINNNTSAIHRSTLQHNYTVSENNDKMYLNYMINSYSLVDYGVSYIMISKPDVTVENVTGFVLTEENPDNVALHYITTNYNDAFTNIELIEPSYSTIESGITWENSYTEGINGIYNIKIAEGVPMTQVMQTFTVKDSDGNILDILYGNINNNAVLYMGEVYTYLLMVEDKAGIKDFAVLNLEIIDTIAPEFYGPNEFTVGTNAVLSFESIKNTLVVVDNYSKNLEINVLYDYYTPNFRTPGTYIICFYATDEYGNRATHLVSVTVKDKIAPVFKNEYGQTVNSMTVYKSTDSVLLIKEVIELLTAEDEIDGKLNITVSNDTYTGNGDKKGTYKITLIATDKSKNTASFSVNVVVTDSMPERTLIIDKRIIIVENDKHLSKEDFANIMKLCSYYNNATTSYTDIDTAVYDQSNSTNGEYVVGYEISTTSGEYSEGSFLVRVVDARNSSDTIKSEKDGIIMTILKWIWNLIVGVFDWFCGLFK